MADVIRVSLKGGLPGGEKWSVNPCFHVISAAEITYSQLLAMGTAINAITIPTGVRALWNSNTNYNGVQLEARSSTGVLEALADVPMVGYVPGNGSGTLPFQAAAVVSLRTNRPGGSGRGRLYLPATGVALDSSTLRIPVATRDAGIAGAKTWLSGIQAAMEAVVPNLPLVVWSRTTLGKFGVTKLLMGDVPDVQRRRRDSLAEAYKELSYP